MEVYIKNECIDIVEERLESHNTHIYNVYYNTALKEELDVIDADVVVKDEHDTEDDIDDIFFENEIQYKKSQPDNMLQDPIKYKTNNVLHSTQKLEKRLDEFKNDLPKSQGNQSGDVQDIQKNIKQLTVRLTRLCENIRDTMACYRRKFNTTSNTHIPTLKDSPRIRKFYCFHCNFYTKTKYYLKKHMMVHKREDEVEMYTCVTCHFTTKRQKSFRRHALIHQDASQTKLYSCELCHYKSKYRYSLTRHHRSVHDTERKKKLACSECDYETGGKNDLLSHIASNHREVKMISCKDCNYMTTKKTDLRKHIKLAHMDMSEVKTFKCKECNYENKRRWHVKRHNLKVHKNANK